MPVYVCKNKICVKFDKEQTHNTVMKFVDGEFTDSGSVCPVCKSKMDRIDPEGFTTTMTGSDNICKRQKIMKAITIKQPWASLIVEGIKDVENRSWGLFRF